MNIAIINDTTGSTHVGCFLTIKMLIKQLSQHGNVITDKNNDVSIMNDVDMFVINGEGSFHHSDIHNPAKRILDKIDILKKYNKPIYFVNATVQDLDDKAIDVLKNTFEKITVREIKSYEYLKENDIKSEVLIDMSFLYDISNIKEVGNHDNLFFDCVVKDTKLKIHEIAKQTKNSKYIELNDTENIDDILGMIKKAKNIHTGRYHGAVFTMMFNKKFTFDVSNTWKIESFFNTFNNVNIHDEIDKLKKFYNTIFNDLTK